MIFKKYLAFVCSIDHVHVRDVLEVMIRLIISLTSGSLKFDLCSRKIARKTDRRIHDFNN